ncbi:hypothetical protein GN244_ATG08297 [Phytophthora infestans]|uniref:Uncharacterized protein n=1 Tax=Phytophthora infestans TaxID=4787 RepID=A0A833SD46_PHYIN|nr:hypothetical protein GN244_ATG08297 [Phytophthora infestans]
MLINSPVRLRCTTSTLFALKVQEGTRSWIAPITTETVGMISGSSVTPLKGSRIWSVLRVTLDRSATITTYSDANCTMVKSSNTIWLEVIDESMAWSSLGDMTAFIGGVLPNFIVASVYDDSACSNTPIQICVAPANVTCHRDGGSHFVIPGCVSSITDYSAALFGAKSPYLIVEEYSSP